MDAELGVKSIYNIKEDRFEFTIECSKYGETIAL